MLRGLQASCEDAPRKRKKYLSDVPTSLIQPQRLASADETESGSDMFGPPNVAPKPDLRRSNPLLLLATMFQHSNSLPGYPVTKDIPLSRAATVNGTIKEESPPTSLFGAQYSDSLFAKRQNEQYDSLAQNNYLLPGELGYQEPRPQPQQPLQQDDPYQMQQRFQQRPANGRKRTNFLSSAADMEYSTLSNILQDNFMSLNPNHLATSTEGTPNSAHSPVLSPHGLNLPKVSSPSSLGTTSYSARTDTMNDGNGTQTSPKSSVGSHEFPPCDVRINQYLLGPTSTHPNVEYPDVIEAIEELKQRDISAYYARNSSLDISFAIGIELGDENGHFSDVNLSYKEPEEIYSRVIKPFSYTPGFHKLIAYLRKRFSKDMLVKMAESMAVYRPSFIACTNLLREADLIFMEQCFQRTLLTYDNFVKISGTPTIVWRRTGEIAYVGKEFTMLTGWTQQQLMGPKPMFIVELLDDESVVEYFQLFSKIAFGDFLGATMTECTLLTSKKHVKIRAGCIWTLKRDVFGIPMMVIGNFLPIT